MHESVVAGDRRPVDRLEPHTRQRAVPGQLHRQVGARLASPFGKHAHRLLV